MPNLVKAKGIDVENFSSTDSATGNGSSTAFLLTQTPRVGTLKVTVNGLKDTDWTLNPATKTVTFGSAPANQQNIIFDYWRV